MHPSTFDWSALPGPNDGTVLNGMPAPAQAAPALIAGRYALGDLIGRGGGGQVYAAHDRLAGEEVAIKRMTAVRGEALARLRREITALRWLRLPGVVRMRDSGLVGEDYFIVMDRIDGRPFPGAERPVPWEALEAVAIDLLEILARVHHAGVVHRDLKPANVLVDRAGRPIVLDFGLAIGRAVSTAEIEARPEGTPAYVAPEQIRGLPCDARTDLYSVGTMLFEALAGWAPHGYSPIRDVIHNRLHLPAPGLHTAAPDAPRRVAAVVDRLLSREPDDRFSAAADVIEALGGHASTIFLGAATRLAPDRPATPEELAPMFRGPDAFLHLAEDGARVLWSRTGGHARVLGEEVGGWVRAGLAFWEGDLLVIERPALERLEQGLAVATAATLPPKALSVPATRLLRWGRLAWPDATPDLLATVSGLEDAAIATALSELRAAGLIWPLPDGRIGAHPGISAAEATDASDALTLARAFPPRSEARFRHLLTSGAAAEDLLPEVISLAEDLLANGRAARAIALLELGLDLLAQVEEGPPLETEDALLRLYCNAALRQESEAAMDRALYELGRGTGRGELQGQLNVLISGSLAAKRREGERARALLDQLPPLPDEGLDTWRQSARIQAILVHGHDVESRFLDELELWAGQSPARLAKLAGWRGNLRYRQSRFLEAAHEHLRGMAGKDRPDARTSSQINAASAFLDALCFDDATTHARAAQAAAIIWRHARYEALSTYILRMTQYRTGHPYAPNEDLIAAATHLGPYMEGLFAIVDAATSWRLAERAQAAALATRAQHAFGQARYPDNELLAEALGLAARGPLPAREADELAMRADRCRAPGMAVQIYGLLALACYAADPRWAQQASALASCRPQKEWGVRLEVLSFDEALTALSERSRMPKRRPSN